MTDYTKVASIVREELAIGGYQTNACILAARVTTMALRQLGEHRVEAMAAELTAISPAYAAMLVAAKRLGRELTADEQQSFIDFGAWMCHVHFGDPEPGALNSRHDENAYLGHVVVLVRRTWLLDPTLGQVNRPAKDLLVEEPYAWPIDYTEVLEKGLTTMSENMTTVRHRLVPRRRNFVTADDWWRAPRDAHTRQVLRRVVKRIRSEAQ